MVEYVFIWVTKGIGGRYVVFLINLVWTLITLAGAGVILVTTFLTLTGEAGFGVVPFLAFVYSRSNSTLIIMNNFLSIFVMFII